MSSRSVFIKSSSLEVVFQGCLLKAPPLNRRGRKKWHERYFVLRANRTLECHKSKKSLEALRSPRRIVDLRECINLEIGLEYKSLQNILSLGTFKRTFFYAAPSVPLMLQWADVVEKAKNAKDGESIEILDIGLRRSKDVHAVHNVKPSSSPSHSFGAHNVKPSLSPTHSFGVQNVKPSSSPTHSFGAHNVKASPSPTHSFGAHVGSPKRDPAANGEKSTMALSHFASGSTDTVDLRLVNERKSGSTSDSSPTHRTSTNSGEGNVHHYPSVSSGSSVSLSSSPVRTMSGLGPPRHQTNTPPSSSVPIKIPNKVPPPFGVLIQASRDKDGFFIKQKEKGLITRHLDGNSEASLPEEVVSKPERFVSNEGNLKRVPVVRGTVHNPKNQRPRRKFQGGSSHLAVSNDKGSPPAAQSSLGVANFHSNLKQSFRYRKIALRKEFEKPLYANDYDSDIDSGDESDAIHSYCGPSSVPRPGELGNLPEILQKEEMPSELSDTESTDVKHSTDSAIKRRINASSQNTSSQNTSSIMSLAGFSLTNSYSKVTIAGPRRSSSSSLPGKRPVIHPRSNSRKGLKNAAERTSGADASPTTPRGLESSIILQPPVMFAEGIENSLELPARPPSDLLYGSCNSLDNILVEPPDMFNIELGFKKSKNSKRKLSRTKRVNSPAKLPTNNGTSDVVYTEAGVDSSDKTGSGIKNDVYSVPKQNQSSVAVSDAVPDRDSTESCDTGYTSSSTSPGYADQSKKQRPKMDFQERATNPIPSCLEPTQVTIENVPSMSSLSSILSDASRCYVPLVFYSAKVEGEGVSRDPNIFSVQVCLVENSDELIKDLVSLKSLESFSLMECDEIQGEENVSAAQVDDFTVETSLEDLEFGFSITKSTQKDLFMRKVCQFTFEIRNLFGTSKPFSCDVEVRHADQLTVLPIEVM